VRVLIIGASKGIGLETTRQALAAGHDVRALSRSAAAIGFSDPRVEKVRGDALKSQDVKTALSGVEVVIQTLGVGLGELFQPVHLFSDATRVLIDAMTTQGVKRLICVTGFGAGDSRASIPWLQRLPFEAFFGRAYGDKSQQERLIRQSELDWTIARPGVLTNGPRTGRFKILTEATQWRNGVISRADVADFLVSQIEGSQSARSCQLTVENQEMRMVTERQASIVYFDGSCPLCRAEIGIYSRHDSDGALCFVDISARSSSVPEGLTQQRALQRFHVQNEKGFSPELPPSSRYGLDCQDGAGLRGWPGFREQSRC
jgi:putative NADH-flavin reductase